MERIDRNGGRADWTEPKPETVFVFDIHGAVHEVVCDRAEGRPAARRPEPEGLSPSVIRRWLAGFAFGLLAPGLLAEPAAAVEPATPPAVAYQSW
jgi:hypothetical protein